jgi:hypothetical protein
MDRGAGHYFFVLVRLHIVLSIFPFLVSNAQFTVYASSGKIGEVP